MSILVNSVDAGPTPGVASSFTYNGFVVPGGLSTSVLVVLMAYGSGGSNVSDASAALTWNGVPLTILGEHAGAAGAAYPRQGIYYLRNPAAGNNPLAASFFLSGSPTALAYAATILLCTGVDQGTTWRAALQAADGASGTSPSLGITTQPGDLAIDMATAQSNGGALQLTKGAPQSLIGLRNNYDATWSSGSSSQAATGTTTTDTWSQNSASGWSQIGAALMPASAGRASANLQHYLRHIAHH